jgi:hypothetical protein
MTDNQVEESSRKLQASLNFGSAIKEIKEKEVSLCEVSTREEEVINIVDIGEMLILMRGNQKEREENQIFSSMS